MSLPGTGRERDFKADDYLYLANALAGGTAGRGRPRTAFLRRATSTAYYALFHELVQHGARRAAGAGPAEHRQAIGRWYAHGNFRKTARWVEDLSRRTHTTGSCTAPLDGYLDGGSPSRS